MGKKSDKNIYEKSRDIDFSEVEDGYVAFNDEAGNVIYLNFSAAAILEICETPLSAEQIYQSFQKGGGAKIDLADVQRCLATLVEHGLLRVTQR